MWKSIIAAWAVAIIPGIAAYAEEAAVAAAEAGGPKVAAVQVTGYDKMYKPRDGFDPVALLLPYIERAGADDVDLLVFPEYHLGRIEIPGPETERIGAAAKAAGAYVAVGGWELLEGGAYANAALLFNRDGELAGKYYKTHAAVDSFDPEAIPWTEPPEGRDAQWFTENDPEWTMERGDRLPVFETDFGKIGILTCYDGWFPEPWRILSLQGAEIVLWLNGRHGAVEDYIVQSEMFRNEFHVIVANQAYGAGTMIGRYPNEIAARTDEPGDAYIAAELPMGRLRHARAHSRNFAQRRPDLYKPLAQSDPAYADYAGAAGNDEAP